MNKLTISNGIKKYNLIIDRNIKVILGPNYKEKFEIIKIIKQISNKTSLSENQEEKQVEFNLSLDNKKINSSNSLFFEVNQFYDLQSDIKMQSKSLVLKYFESKILENEFSDEFFSVNGSLSIFNDLINSDDFEIKNYFVDFNSKQLLKLMSPVLISNDLICNQFDFDYDDIVILQLKMIFNILKTNKDKYAFVIIDIPVLSVKIKKYLDILSSYCIVLTFTNYSNIELKLSQCSYINNRYFDFNDEETLNELFLSVPFTLTKEEVLTKMKELITNKERQNTIIKYL